MILVTGGTGNCGREIVDALVAKGVGFRMMARNPGKVTVTGKGVEVVVGDLADPASLGAALKGVEKALLLSPPVPNQVELETHFLKAAKKAGVRHIVKFSAMTADPKAESRFPRGHGEIEKKIKDAHILWTFLRPTFFMQNLLGLAGMVKAGTIYQPAGKARERRSSIRP